MKFAGSNPFSGRRHLDLVLDAIFCLWLIHIALTGQLVPNAIVDLLRADAPIVAVSEPGSAPSVQDYQPLPET
jgi:hypothetical protein